MTTRWNPRNTHTPFPVPWHSTGGGANTNFNLNSAYTYGSAGASIMQAFVAHETGNLTDFWFRVDSYQGTWSSTDQTIEWSLREALNGSRIPGSTVTGSGTIDLSASPTGWVKVTGLSVAVTAGKFYCLVLSDADGHATNHVRIRINGASMGGEQGRGMSYATTGNSTTNGWSTTGSTTSLPLTMAVKIAGNIQVFSPIIDALSTNASTSNAVGYRFRPKEDCTLVGVSMGGGDHTILYNNAHDFKLHADATAPGGSALTSFTCAPSTYSGSSDIPHGVIFPSTAWYDLRAGTWYRFVIDPAVSLTVPRTQTAGGSPDADLLAAAFPFGGDCYWTRENAGAWADDTTTLGGMSMILLPAQRKGPPTYLLGA